jgi:hypothetical protein
VPQQDSVVSRFRTACSAENSLCGDLNGSILIWTTVESLNMNFDVNH